MGMGIQKDVQEEEKRKENLGVMAAQKSVAEIARLISLEDIRHRYMLAVREVGGKKSERDFRGRETETRKAVPKTNWKTLKISQSRPRPILESHSLLLPSSPYFPLLLVSLGRSTFTIPSCTLFPLSHGTFLSTSFIS